MSFWATAMVAAQNSAVIDSDPGDHVRAAQS